jgi:hypothetical protein
MVSTGNQLAIESSDLVVHRLGDATLPTPMATLLKGRASSPHYVHESDRVLLDDTVEMAVAPGVGVAELPSLEPGGPPPAAATRWTPMATSGCPYWRRPGSPGVPLRQQGAQAEGTVET